MSNVKLYYIDLDIDEIKFDDLTVKYTVEYCNYLYGTIYEYMINYYKRKNIF